MEIKTYKVLELYNPIAAHCVNTSTFCFTNAPRYVFSPTNIAPRIPHRLFVPKESFRAMCRG